MKRSKSLGFEGRFRALTPIVSNAFHLAVLARRSVGANAWAEMSSTQRQQYLAAFREFSIANHAARFRGFSGQRFEITGERKIGSAQVLVRTQIVQPSGKSIPINYLMIESDGKWGIADVYLRGSISEVATRRSEFGSIVKSRGVDGLIEAIKRKTAALKS